MKEGSTPVDDSSARTLQDLRTSTSLAPLRTMLNSPTKSALVIRRGNQRRFNMFAPGAAIRGFPEPRSHAAPSVEAIDAASYLMRTLESVPGTLRLGSTGSDYREQFSSGMMSWRTIAAEAMAMLQRISVRSNVYEAILDDPSPRTREVSTAEFLKILSQRSATVFDSRTRLEYAIGHIPGALSVAQKPGSPMSQYVSDVVEIGRTIGDRKAAVIVYCNGPFCGKSKRLGEELLNAGFSNVRRYQLGTPAWRALVGPMEIEPEGIRYIQKGDQTAVFLDARNPEEFAAGSLPGARNVRVGDIVAAKDDGRLPMDDFNTRVIVFGQSGAQALELAALLAQNGFNNVKFYGSAFSSLINALQ